MSGDATILDKIFQLTRAQLDNATAPVPDHSQVVKSMTWCQVRRVSAFWRDRSVDPRVACDDACRDLVTGLAHLRTPCAYWIAGAPTKLSIRYGVPRKDTIAAEALQGILGASFPDIRLAPASLAYDESNPGRFQALLLTGIPSAKTGSGNSASTEQIEKLCRGLYGAHWSYLVLAEPIPRNEVAAALNEVTAETRAVLNTSMLKGTIDEENRVAQRYVELLDAQAKRFEAARGSGLWAVQSILFAENEVWLARGGAALLNAFAGEQSHPVPLRLLPCNARGEASRPKCEPLTSRELSALLQIPTESYSGYEVVEPARFSLHPPVTERSEHARVCLGEIMDRGQPVGNALDIPLRDLSKHVLIAGVTGSGKTNTAFKLLEDLWLEHQIPFLAIESAKSEYRDLCSIPAFRDLRVYTLGDETLAPFRLNPFEVPPGVLVQTHIDYVKALFAASFVLYPPMPYVLEQSLQEIFEDRGWNLATNTNHRGLDPSQAYPTLSDLHTKVDIVVRRLGYDQRLTMDITAGLQARINQLRIGGGKGRMLDTRRSLPVGELLAGPCLLELKQIVSDDEKAFLIGLIMIRLLEHLEVVRAESPRSGLRHVLFIEEAHRLLRNVSEHSGEDTANPRGRAVEVFANILAEVRAFGEGIVILEQVPAKLAPDAIKNTNLKIVHRIVARDDRETLGAAMQADSQQTDYFGLLGTGESVVFAEGMNCPALVSVPLSAAKQRAAAKTDDEQVKHAWRTSANLALYQRSRWCADCPKADVSVRCAADMSVWRGDGRPTFEAFYSAVAHNRAFLRQTYADVELRCRGFGRRQPCEVVCTVNAFLEDAIEARAAAAGWSFASVSKLAEAAIATTKELAVESDARDPKAAERAMAKTGARYGRNVEMLSTSSEGPFAACCLCENRCVYRYEGSNGNKLGTTGGLFQEEFAESSGDAARLAPLAWGLSRSYVHSKDVTTRLAVSLCFAVQQAAELRLSTANQRNLVGGIREELQKLAEEEHGEITG